MVTSNGSASPLTPSSIGLRRRRPRCVGSFRRIIGDHLISGYRQLSGDSQPERSRGRPRGRPIRVADRVACRDVLLARVAVRLKYAENVRHRVIGVVETRRGARMRRIVSNLVPVTIADEEFTSGAGGGVSRKGRRNQIGCVPSPQLYVLFDPFPNQVGWYSQHGTATQSWPYCETSPM